MDNIRQTQTMTKYKKSKNEFLKVILFDLVYDKRDISNH